MYENTTFRFNVQCTYEDVEVRATSTNEAMELAKQKARESGKLIESKVLGGTFVMDGIRFPLIDGPAACHIMERWKKNIQESEKPVLFHEIHQKSRKLMDYLERDYQGNVAIPAMLMLDHALRVMISDYLGRRTPIEDGGQ